MMFFGDLLSGNVMSVPCTPTDINNITNIEYYFLTFGKT